METVPDDRGDAALAFLSLIAREKIALERVDIPDDLHPELEQSLPIGCAGFADQADLCQLFLRVLLGMEEADAFGALITSALFVDESALTFEDVDHLCPAGVEIIFYHRIGDGHDLSDLVHFEFIHFF